MVLAIVHLSDMKRAVELSTRLGFEVELHS